METVPAHLVPLALGELDAATAETLKPCGRKVGERVELDLESVERSGRGDVASVLRAYQRLCEKFWDSYEAKRPAGPYVAVKRELLLAQQKSTKTEKKDLGEQLEALEGVPGVADVIREVTEAAPDWDKVRAAGAPFGIDLDLEKEGWAVVTLWVEGAHDWPLALGGPASRGEVRRGVRLRVAYAGWRDRRNRRLAEVHVLTEEIWPAPPRMRSL